MGLKWCQATPLWYDTCKSMRYFFILGRNPELSCAELHAVLPTGYTVLAYFPPELIVECEALDIPVLTKRLGGTIKAGEILESRHPESQRDEGSRPAAAGRDLHSQEILRSLRSLRMTDDNKKLFLGLSAYALEKSVRLPSVRELRELGIEVKRELQEQSYKVRLVTSKEIALSSVIVKKERLLRQGAELALFYGGPPNRTTQSLTPNPYHLEPKFIGRTLAVQEFEDASARDFGRPERSMGVGMLPIQLTKIMLNLAHAPMDATILDPFCGLGTVLMEATQMGYTHLIGTDLEQKMIDATRENLQWLAKRAGVASENSRQPTPFSNFRQRRTGALVSLGLELENIKLIATSVEQISKHLPPHSVDGIVTEPYMGPTKEVTNYKLQITNLIDLYIAAFREFSKILKPKGHVVFILPAFKSGATLTKTSDRVLPEIKKLGFQPIQLLPSPYSLTPSPSILYSRPDQRVLREIFVLQFKP